MKQQLLLLAASSLMVGAVSAANEPLVYSNESFCRMSPNGRWAVSAGFGSFRVFDLQNDDTYEPTDPYAETTPEDEYSNYYPNAGYGVAVSDDGVVVGTITYAGTAAYWAPNSDDFEGAWHLLPTISDAGSGANGITPDGSRIVGYCMPKETDYSTDDIYVVPVLWQRNDAGEYELVELPLIEKDFTGRMPQYIIAHAISEDGKTIAAQMTTYDGYYHSPVLYTEGADGTWTGTLLHSELQAGNAVFPEWVAEPKYPSAADYMDAERYEEYESQSDAYWSAYWTAFWNDEEFNDVEPSIDDFITEEELAAYNEAVAAYQAWYDNVYTPFQNVYYALMGDDGLGIPEFLMNQVCLSGNGQYYAATKAEGDFFSGFTYEPFVFDLSSDAINRYEDSAVLVNYVNSQGAMLGAIKAPDGYMSSAWICPAGQKNFMLLEDYLGKRSPSTYTWLQENGQCTYYVGYTEDYSGMLTETDIMLGLPVSCEDLSKIVSYRYDIMAEDEDQVLLSFVFDTTPDAGINDVVSNNATDVTVAVDTNGNITISGKAAAVNVYDLSGRNVFSTQAPQGTISTGLPKGVYIVKAISTSGNTAVVKAQI